MAKRNISWDENKLNKWIQEGRGQGEGKDYKPWLTVQDFPSKGRVTRIFGWKTKRTHHFFTDTETRYFYLLEWEDDVLDIREHYPLFNCEEVIENKAGLNFHLFKDKDIGTPYILSTSFLITLKKPNGKIEYLARSLKADYELERKTALERLEIERRYWQSQNIDWGIVTQKEIPVVKAKNIEWIHSSLYPTDERGFTDEEADYYCNAFIEKLAGSSTSIRDFTTQFDRLFNLDTGSGVYIFKRLIALKRIMVDMNKKIDLNDSTQSIEIVQQSLPERVGVL
ncbi:TnsA endonuclease C-terminal domain-containing protein [Thermoanaerobacterium sp. RBIITD]|uniref:TnsA endonuclease C-terminal domain-containing protein n=1 Tax=Thermoanaerobacterium sp. RBIITD TaxID=1550240 RepID=UPI000BB8BBFE|nr:TnsA endonuclease C-terminal domain-containing protein [Thermoanaerobacterium sp. RBIITD]SNX54446.1 TnsA endonuclease N terminal [Thermoanaerobacterium sp. RBIITD]